MIKKLFLTVALSALSFAGFSANSYKLDEVKMDNMFANATEISATSMDLSSTFVVEGDKTVGGYLVRAFFCGFIGLHRSYMGTGGKSVWWWYCCVPVLGGVTTFVDFWGVVFMGQKQLDKYKDNSKKVVWM